MGLGRIGRTGLGEWLEPTAATAAALASAESAATIAPTLSVGVGAREAALEMLRGGIIAPAELARLAGLVTLSPRVEGQS